MFLNSLILTCFIINTSAAELARAIDQIVMDYEEQKKQYAQIEQSLAAKNAEIQQLDTKITSAEQAVNAANQVEDKKSNALADALKNKVGRAALSELSKEFETAQNMHEKAEAELKNIQNQRDNSFNQLQKLNGTLEQSRLKSNQLVEELLTAQFATTKEVEVKVNRVCHEEETLRQCKEKAIEDAKKQGLDQGVGLLVDSFSKLSFQNEQWNIDKKEIVSEGSGTVSNLTWLEPLEIIKGAYVGKMKAKIQGQVPPSLKQRLQILKKGEVVKVVEKPSGINELEDSKRVPEKKVTSEEIFTDCENCPEMVTLKGGRFWMGSERELADSDEKPVHEVEIKAFAIGRYEITTKQYLSCVHDKKCSPPKWLETNSEFNVTSGTKDNYKAFIEDFQPIVGISWFNAIDYTKWLSEKTSKSYRLPSEAEWEYAARANTKAKNYGFNGDIKDLSDYAWYAENSNSKTHPIGQKQPNAFGLYDMHGNVQEWVQDIWHSNYEGAPLNGAAWEEKETANEPIKRVLRGGSWFIGISKDLRSASRNKLPPDKRDSSSGFRVACCTHN